MIESTTITLAEMKVLRQRATAILDRGLLTAQDRQEIDRLIGRIETLRVRSDLATMKAHTDRAIAAIAAAAGSPLGYGDDADDAELAIGLARSGWEVRGGVLHAPDPATLALVPLWPAEDVFGALPADPLAAATVKTLRASLQPSYRSAYLAWLQHAARLGAVAAHARLSSAQQKVLSEGQDAAGGYAVPADFAAGIMARVAERSIVRRGADVRQTVRDRLVLPRWQPHATEGSVYSSGFVGDWVGETPVQADAGATFGQVAISIFKSRARTRLSNDLVDDVPNLVAFLTQNGGENLAVVEDRAFIAGTGVGQPLGILNGGAPTVDVEGSTSNTISNTTAAPGSAPKLIDLEAALPDQYSPEARWLMRRATEKAVRKLVDGQGRYHFPTERDPLGNRLLMDYPVSISAAMEAEGTDGSRVAVLGNLRAGYVVANRALLTVVVARERYADTDETLFILFDRVGGVLTNPDAVRAATV